MELFVWKSGLSFRGKVKDLTIMLRELPHDLTLKQLIQLKLH